MKKFYLRFFSFLGFGIVFYLLLLMLLGNNIKGSFLRNFNYDRFGTTYERFQEVKKVNKVDIIFLGSSHAFRGFDPRFFAKKGIRIFNLGSNSQTQMQNLILLKRYLNQIKVKLVVIEVDPNGFERDGVESSLNLAANDIKDYNSIEIALKVNSMKTYNNLLYGYSKQLMGMDNRMYSAEKKSIDCQIDKYIAGGYVERKLSYFNDTSGLMKFKLDLLPEQLTALDEVIAMLKKNNIDYLLVQTPITHASYSRFINPSEVDSIFSSKGKYYNFNTLMDLNDTLYFYDLQHLNQLGVEKFNNEFIQQVKIDSILNSKQ